MDFEVTEKDIVSWFSFWNANFGGHEELKKEHREMYECSKKGDCDFFVSDGSVRRVVRNKGSDFFSVLFAERCKYQVKSERDREVAPSGIVGACSSYDEVQPERWLREYTLFK